MASMSMTTSPSSTMPGMSMATGDSMSQSHNSLMGMDAMAMTFFTSPSTPLYSMTWTPNSLGHYAGTCIFLIVFAAIFRGLVAIRINIYNILSARQIRHEGSVINMHHTQTQSPRPWRAHEAVTVASLDVVLAGVSYLLMIAVMTMNVGYFMSVLAGVFVGSMVFGRFLGNTATH